MLFRPKNKAIGGISETYLFQIRDTDNSPAVQFPWCFLGLEYYPQFHLLLFVNKVCTQFGEPFATGIIQFHTILFYRFIEPKDVFQKVLFLILLYLLIVEEGKEILLSKLWVAGIQPWEMFFLVETAHKLIAGFHTLVEQRREGILSVY